MQIRLRDFDIKAEYLVITDLQRRYSCALALALFHRRNNLAPTRRDVAQFVKFAVVTGANDARISGHSRRLVGDSARDFVTNVGQLVQFLAKQEETPARFDKVTLPRGFFPAR